MRNRILVLVILILPPALFIFFWMNPGALKEPADGASKGPQEAAGTNAPVESTNLAPGNVK